MNVYLFDGFGNAGEMLRLLSDSLIPTDEETNLQMDIFQAHGLENRGNNKSGDQKMCDDGDATHKCT